MQDSIYRGHTTNPDARAAARELRAQLRGADEGTILFFCSSEYDLDVLASELRDQFAGMQLVGCTTAGEIGPAGYIDHSLCGVAFPASDFAVSIGALRDVAGFEFGAGAAFIQSSLQNLERQPAYLSGGNTFAFLMIDGMSRREELVTRSLQNALGDIPMVGGSAGDGLKFEDTRVFLDGEFRPNAGAVVLVSSCRPFRVFKTQHFVPGEERFVVTRADASRRVVYEINGLPASEEYARLIGVDAGRLEPASFAGTPVVVLIDGGNYVRSIQTANPDGSLTFFCAIEEGLVLRAAHGVDLVANMEAAFDEVCAQIGEPLLTLACDCVLRKVEIFNNGLDHQVADVFRRNYAVGMGTYGEQYHGVHINQTLTGVVIGAKGGEDG